MIKTLDQYNEILGIETKHPLNEESFKNKMAQAYRMIYAAKVNKIDMEQGSELSQMYKISNYQGKRTKLLLALRKYVIETKGVDEVGDVLVNYKLFKTKKFICDTFLPEHDVIVNMDDYSSHATKTARENDINGARLYRSCGYKVACIRDEELKALPNATNFFNKSYLSKNEKKNLLKFYCKLLKIKKLKECDFDKIISSYDTEDLYLSKDEIKGCETIHKEEIEDYSGYRTAWNNEFNSRS